MSSKTYHKVLEITDTHVICENKNALWWLGGATFKLPKDEKLQNVKTGDVVEMVLDSND